MDTNVYCDDDWKGHSVTSARVDLWIDNNGDVDRMRSSLASRRYDVDVGRAGVRVGCAAQSL